MDGGRDAKIKNGEVENGLGVQHVVVAFSPFVVP